jgi:hypothetical protein
MKKYLFGIFAIALAVVFSAFTTNRSTLYVYEGTAFTSTDLDNGIDWVRDGSPSSYTCNGGGDFECSFLAATDEGPNLNGYVITINGSREVTSVVLPDEHEVSISSPTKAEDPAK